MSHIQSEEATPPIALRDHNLQVLALTLFDASVAAHRLGDRERSLLQVAAAYYDAVGTAEHAGRRARDMVLAAPIDGLKPSQQCVIASALAFQRQKVRSSREVAFLRLSKHEQATALRLAAMLGLADALRGADALLRGNGDALELQVSGAAQTASAEQHAVRWRKRIGALTVVEASPDTQSMIEQLPTNDVSPLLTITLPAEHSEQLRGDESIAEGARRTLRRLFERMLAREKDVREGEDPEDVHQMRVATRRLRASLQIVEPLYDPALIRAFRRKLRGIAQALGDVRDRDVFLIDLAAHRETLPPEQRDALNPLLARVEHARTAARTTLLETLHSKRYDKFKHAFATFLTTPGAGVADLPETGVPPRVRDRAGAMLWQRYEDWRAFEAALPNAADTTLHQARIAGKRLRYTIEFFAEALGPKTEELLVPLTALQENLGALQDAVVARDYVHTLALDADPGAQAYVASRGIARDEQLAAFPRLWEKVASATYRRKLFELIVKM